MTDASLQRVLRTPRPFTHSTGQLAVRLPGGKFHYFGRHDDPAAAVRCREFLARLLVDMGYVLVATRGTAQAIEQAGIPVKAVNKVKDGRPHIVDLLKNGDIHLVITTVSEVRSQIADSRSIRTTALAQRVTYYTTIAGGRAAIEGKKHIASLEVYDVQSLHRSLAAPAAGQPVAQH